MDATAVSMPAAQFKKRFGLIPARIGRSFAHKLGVAMPLEPPEYSTITKVVGSKARTRLGTQKSPYEYGHVEGHQVPVPVKALPGATVQLDVQDLSRLEDDLVPHVKWACMHPGCAGKRWESKSALIQGHDDSRKLAEEAERSPAGQAHVYYGVLEIAGTPEKKDDKGRVVTDAKHPVIMLLSDEE